jgi:hypothetical protein
MSLPPMIGGQGWPSSGSKENCITPKTYGYFPESGDMAAFGTTLGKWMEPSAMRPTSVLHQGPAEEKETAASDSNNSKNNVLAETVVRLEVQLATVVAQQKRNEELLSALLAKL